MSADMETEDFRVFFDSDGVTLVSKNTGETAHELGDDELAQIQAAIRAWRRTRALSGRLANPKPSKCPECGHLFASHMPESGRCCVKAGCDCLRTHNPVVRIKTPSEPDTGLIDIDPHGLLRILDPRAVRPADANGD